MDSPAASTKFHYHIRWLGSGLLDWERHDTTAEAQGVAERLSFSLPGEQYSIEKRFDEACAKCRKGVGKA